jgi:hypothetical protein
MNTNNNNKKYEHNNKQNEINKITKYDMKVTRDRKEMNE